MSDCDDARRQKPITIRWDGMVGRLTVDGEAWGAIEWSVKRGMWCIEDAEGGCLRHASSIHGKAAAKDEAIALAERFVRDGTLPTPEEAKRLRHEERERRAKQPSQIRRRQAREERHRLFRASMEAEHRERESDSAEGPLYEAVVDVLDLADPEVWKSNSFARLRARLITTVQATIAELEYQRARWDHSSETEKRLARAREILALLQSAARPR